MSVPQLLICGGIGPSLKLLLFKVLLKLDEVSVLQNDSNKKRTLRYCRLKSCWGAKRDCSAKYVNFLDFRIFAKKLLIWSYLYCFHRKEPWLPLSNIFFPINPLSSKYGCISISCTCSVRYRWIFAPWTSILNESSFRYLPSASFDGTIIQPIALKGLENLPFVSTNQRVDHFLPGWISFPILELSRSIINNMCVRYLLFLMFSWGQRSTLND